MLETIVIIVVALIVVPLIYAETKPAMFHKRHVGHVRPATLHGKTHERLWHDGAHDGAAI